MRRQTTSRDLAGLLEDIGLEEVEQRDGEVWARCPHHEDNNPSWSMNADTGAHFCFSCGYKGSLLMLLIDKADMNVFSAKRFMREFGLGDMELPERAPDEPAPLQTTPESKLNGLPLPPTKEIERRNLTPLSVMRFGIKWREKRDAWILPIRTPAGKLLGWQEKTKTATRNLPLNVEKSKTVFGAEFLKRTAKVILVESPLDVVYLHTLGYENAFASFGAAVSDVQMRMLMAYGETICVALDHDEAGEKNAWRLRETYGPATKARLSFVHYDIQTKAKDLGEMDPEEAVWSIENEIPYLSWRPTIWSPTDHVPRRVVPAQRERRVRRTEVTSKYAFRRKY